MNEGLISWNFANFITVILMFLVLWGTAGIISHFTRGKKSNVVQFGSGGSQGATGSAPGVSYGMNFNLAA